MPRARVKIAVSDNYADLINKDLYEPVVAEIMNDSLVVFPHKYERILVQSHGESDYKDLTNGQMIDVKLIFKEKQCYILAQGKKALQKWLESLEDEIAELMELLVQECPDCQNTSLYFEIVSRLKAIKRGEDVVLFLPYPLAVRRKDGTVSYLTANIFQLIYNDIEKNTPEILEEKRVYIVYPTPDDRIALAELSDAESDIEYLESQILAEYVSIEISV